MMLASSSIIEHMPPEIMHLIVWYLPRDRDIVAFKRAFKPGSVHGIAIEAALRIRRMQLLGIANRWVDSANGALAVAGSAAMPGFNDFADVDIFVLNAGADIQYPTVDGVPVPPVRSDEVDPRYPVSIHVTTIVIPFYGKLQLVRYVDPDTADGDDHASGIGADVVSKTLPSILDDFDIPYAAVGYAHTGQLQYGSHYGSGVYSCCVIKKAPPEFRWSAVQQAIRRARRYMFKYGLELDTTELAGYAEKYRAGWSLRLKSQ